MRVDPQRLIRLAVLIRHGTFSRAAGHLGLTQPALSQSIAQMEKEVGVKLIERTPHGVEPTIYGLLLYEHAKSIDRELAEAAQHVQELAFGHKGAIKIGASTGGAASLVALAVCRMLKSSPGVDIRLDEEPSIKSLLAQLHDRSLDMLICQRPNEVELKGIRTLSLFRPGGRRGSARGTLCEAPPRCGSCRHFPSCVRRRRSASCLASGRSFPPST